jgi:ABC-type antimicrobial peptide transport system permease subunit
MTDTRTSLAIIALIVSVAVLFLLLLVRLFGRVTWEIKQLKEINVMLQGQVTALSTLMTDVINGLDDAAREVVSNNFKTFLGKRVSINPPALSDEDKNTFDQAYTMTVLAIIEEIKPPQFQQKEGGPDLQAQKPGPLSDWRNLTK